MRKCLEVPGRVVRRYLPAVLGLLALLISGSARAAGVEFQAQVSADSVEVGDTISLEVNVSVPERSKISQLVMPKFKGFEQLSRSSSTQTSFVWGSGGATTSQTVVYTILLRAVSSGAKTLTPGILKYGGRSFNTRPITVIVLKAGQGGNARRRGASPHRGASPGFGSGGLFGGGGAAGSHGSGRAGRQPDPFDPFGGIDPFAMLRGGRGTGSDADTLLRVVADKKEIYLGEQVTLYVQVLSRFGISDISRFVSPKLDGFMVEDLNSPKRVTPTTKYVNGVQYSAYLVRRKALFPVRAGRLVIDPYEVEIASGIGFLRSGRKIVRRSRPITLTVKPLPEQGQPPGFNPSNVGQFKLAATVDSANVELGQTLTLSIRVSGDGNLRSLGLPSLSTAEGFKIYDPTETLRPKIRGARFGGVKKAEIVLVPTRSGQLVIPALELPVFDPAAGRYRRLKTRPLLVEVRAGAGQAVAGVLPGNLLPAGGASNVLDPDGLSTIRYSTELRRLAEVPWKQGPFLGLLLFPLLGFGLLLGGQTMLARRRQSQGDDRGRRARSIAKAGLKGARKKQKAGEGREACSEMGQAVLDFLAEHTALPARGMPAPQRTESLVAEGFSAAIVERLNRLIEQSEAARYAPGDPSAKQVEVMMHESEHVIEALLDEAEALS